MGKLALGVVVLAMTSTGCAFMFKGTKQEVHFSSTPNGSDVRIDGKYLGETPLDAEIDRDRSQNVLVTKDGFEEQRVQVRKQNDAAWMFWDIGTCIIPVTLCIPLLVDAISGSWHSYDDAYRVKLEPLPMAQAPRAARKPQPSPEEEQTE